MNRLTERINGIRTQYGNKRILLLEGTDDALAIETLLDRVNPDWVNQWAVYPAGSKRQVLALAMQAPANWLALVDKDEWTAGEIADYGNQHPGLHILPRFCIESYLVDPNELWVALPVGQQDRLPGGVTALAQALLVDLPQWQQHAARWHAINPLWSALRALGFKESLLRTSPFPDQAEVVETLQKWGDLLDQARLLEEINLAQVTFSQLPQDTFLHGCLYAKAFFPQVVVPVLGRLFGQQDERAWRRHLFQQRAMPLDLLPLWQRMGLT